MVNLEIRQNSKFKFGYPYNSSVDSYFELLSDEFITNYNLTQSQITEINNHKNAVSAFDTKLFKYLIKLSEFIKSFEQKNKPIIDKYESLVQQQVDLQIKFDKIKETSNKNNDELNYITKNITNLKSDLEKINEFITYYESQITVETTVYNSTYITDTKNRLSIIDNIIDKNNKDLIYYSNVLENKIIDYISTLSPLKQYDFKATSIKSYYESWKERPEEYYSSLVSYYSDEYNSYWTYGKSIMYDQNLSYSKASNEIVKEIAATLQSVLIKSYNFKLEKEIKEYSLEWLNSHENFEPYDFTYAVETKKSTILKSMILEVENIIGDKSKSLKSVVSNKMYKDYNKYKELIQMKRKYVFMNLSKGLDSDMLKNYDTKIALLEDNYLTVKAKLEQKTYWIYFYDLERYRALLTELNRQLTINTLAMSRDFKKESGKNDTFNEKIDYYKKEKENINKKINDMDTMKDSLELTKNIQQDNITLMKSKLFDLKQSINDITKSYIPLFESRIAFFTQNSEKPENDSIHDLIEGKIHNGFRTEYLNLSRYSSSVLWFNKQDKNKLFEMYKRIIDIIDRETLKQWTYEFNQNIITKQKVSYYSTYVDKQILHIYGEIQYLVKQGTYDKDSEIKIENDIKNIINVFEEYVKLAFKAGVNIEISPDIFDYDKKFIFKIIDNIETEDNVNKTFKKFMNNNLNYLKEKNLNFKLNETNKEKQIKIDTIWNDMEKKYV